MTRLQLLTSTVLLSTSAFAATLSSSAVADAAERRDFTVVQSLMKQKADVNAAQADGSTALLWATHWNDLATAKALIAAGAKVNVHNSLNASPLSEAAALGGMPLFDALVNAGGDPKTLTTPDGETLLMTAARAGSLPIVKLLADKGVDINAQETYKNQTALMWAAAERHSDIVKFLLDRGADWKVKTLLHEPKVPKLSAASSISPMARGGLNALSFAARNGDIESIKALLDHGVDINLGDGENSTPLVIALMNKEYTAAKYLLDRGADVNLQDNFGRAALFAAIDIRNEDWSAMPRRPQVDPMPSLDIIKEVLKHQPDVNAEMVKALPGRSGMDAGDSAIGKGATPLMRAARAGDIDVFRLLLDAGADINKKTAQGNTALLFAAGVSFRDKQTSGLETGALEILKESLNRGQDLKQANAQGDTALHGAATRGADLIAAYLIEQHIDLDARNSRGFTPLDVAMGKGSFGLPTPHESTVALLKKLGAKDSSQMPPMPRPAKGGFSGAAGPKPVAPKPSQQ
jgi:ankyrin repeat protein